MFRIATYNVHKCVGLDRRVHPSRIAGVLRETEADVIALQEVLGGDDGEGEANHLRGIADELGFEFCAGINRSIRGVGYGNAVLSHFPLRSHRNHDITRPGLEPRGCLEAEITITNDGRNLPLRVFNVHLGTSFMERRYQAKRLLGGIIDKEKPTDAPRIVLGDFNEWTRGLASRMFNAEFECAEPREHVARSLLVRGRTYPGVLPFLHLDHIYYDAGLKLRGLKLWRNARSLVASDHLPLVADFRFDVV
ncbi:MAG: endonuclease/exonuclease/phosphatase family protein [Pyrinomonadaceae bacterium MAG19_C2-C3]|nr:endonuclease/exonuclease/phosphatase family protein [Pyrinomonadaceae bacterium MAG19_C2-C3]